MALVMRTELSSHADIQQHKVRRRVEVEKVGDPPPQGVGVHHSDKDVAGVEVCSSRRTLLANALVQ